MSARAEARRARPEDLHGGLRGTAAVARPLACTPPRAEKGRVLGVTHRDAKPSNMSPEQRGGSRTRPHAAENRSERARFGRGASRTPQSLAPGLAPVAVAARSSGAELPAVDPPSSVAIGGGEASRTQRNPHGIELFSLRLLRRTALHAGGGPADLLVARSQGSEGRCDRPRPTASGKPGGDRLRRPLRWLAGGLHRRSRRVSWVQDERTATHSNAEGRSSRLTNVRTAGAWSSHVADLARLPGDVGREASLTGAQNAPQMTRVTEDAARDGRVSVAPAWRVTP